MSSDNTVCWPATGPAAAALNLSMVRAMACSSSAGIDDDSAAGVTAGLGSGVQAEIVTSAATISTASGDLGRCSAPAVIQLRPLRNDLGLWVVEPAVGQHDPPLRGALPTAWAVPGRRKRLIKVEPG